VLESYYQLATRQKANIDKAMQTFIELLEKDQDYLPAVLGMATGFMVEKAEVRQRTANSEQPSENKLCSHSLT
jgi:tetratricopeptide repeat protein 21B